MDQRAALLWYHDHVMGVTRFGVYAGLAGLWIIRDQRERELGLPEGPPFEVPLLIQDRNFGLDDSGRLTGQLIHKTDPEVMEAFPPFTVVNGKIWPLLQVQPTTYRLRSVTVPVGPILSVRTRSWVSAARSPGAALGRVA
jgi:FtsP/CotA-like multicopper oxidase with cupredoxin domain